MPIALILRDGVPERVFASVDERTAFYAACAVEHVPIDPAWVDAEDDAHETVPDMTTHAWNGTTFAPLPPVVPPAPIADTRLTVTQFKRRMTGEERDRIEMAQTDHPDALVRARLRRMEKDLNGVQQQIADRADPELQQGIAWLTTVQFDGAPLIASMARAIEIIGADAFDAGNLA